VDLQAIDHHVEAVEDLAFDFRERLSLEDLKGCPGPWTHSIVRNLDLPVV
jgi:hypothetical protein